MRIFILMLKKKSPKEILKMPLIGGYLNSQLFNLASADRYSEAMRMKTN